MLENIIQTVPWFKQRPLDEFVLPPLYSLNKLVNECSDATCVWGYTKLLYKEAEALWSSKVAQRFELCVEVVIRTSHGTPMLLQLQQCAQQAQLMEVTSGGSVGVWLCVCLLLWCVWGRVLGSISELVGLVTQKEACLDRVQDATVAGEPEDCQPGGLPGSQADEDFRAQSQSKLQAEEDFQAQSQTQLQAEKNIQAQSQPKTQPPQAQVSPNPPAISSQYIPRRDRSPIQLRPVTSNSPRFVTAQSHFSPSPGKMTGMALSPVRLQPLNCQIDTPSKGLVFDLTTKEGRQVWKDHIVNKMKRKNEESKVYYDKNGKPVRRVFVAGRGWVSAKKLAQESVCM